MISVQSRLPQLNGNKIWFAFLIGCLVYTTGACQASKPATKPKTVQVAPKIPAKDTMKPRNHKLTDNRNSKHNVAFDSLAAIFPLTIKNTYTISIFLPLYLDSANREVSQKGNLTVVRDFYKGVLMALDTLKKCGVRLEIHTFDSEKNWNYNSLEDTLIANETDLIMGPVLDSRIKGWVDSFSERHKINYVAPLLSNDKSGNKNYYFQSTPTSMNEGAAAASLVKRDYRGYKIFIIMEKKGKPNSMGEAFISKFAKKDITVLDLNSHGSKALPEKIYFEDSNIIVIPSSHEPFVSAIMSKLRVDSAHQMVIIGPMQWQFFKTFEGELWEKKKMHLISPYFIDYENSAINGFVGAYRSRYQEDPSVWSFFGFDEMAYYANMMSAYGKYFQLRIGNQSTPMLHSTYRLRHNVGGNGWQNEYVNILKFENYRLVRVVH